MFFFFVSCPVLTGEDNKEDDGDINEEELEISKVTEDLRNKNNRSGTVCLINSSATIDVEAALHTE